MGGGGGFVSMPGPIRNKHNPSTLTNMSLPFSHEDKLQARSHGCRRRVLVPDTEGGI